MPRLTIETCTGKQIEGVAETVELKRTDGTVYETAVADRYGELCIAKAVSSDKRRFGGKAYTVTHVPTGLSIMWVKYKKDAKHILGMIHDLGLDLSFDRNSDIPDETKYPLRTLARNVINAFGEDRVTRN